MVSVKKKVCMLGEPGVGKTSIVQRILYDRFDGKYRPTAGTKMSMKEFEIDGNTVTLMIWDILGQKGFPSLREMYFMKAAGGLLVIDPNDQISAASIQEWYDSFRSVAGDVPIKVALNKADIPGADLGPIEDKLGSLDLEVVRTSAKTGEGVKETFIALAKAVGGV